MISILRLWHLDLVNIDFFLHIKASKRHSIATEIPKFLKGTHKFQIG